MAKNVLQSAKFKKDHMMLLAFLLFFLIVAAEIFLSFWLPLHLRIDSMWAEQVARHELIDLYDIVRGQSRKISENSAVPVSAEALLICRSLDRAAAAMHKYGKDFTPVQCRPFMEVIQKLHVHNNRLSNDKPFSREIELNTQVFLQKLRGVQTAPAAR